MNQSEIDRAEHYWICDECAEAKGWKPVEYGVTMVREACPYCGEVKFLACTHTDFIKPGQKVQLWD